MVHLVAVASGAMRIGGAVRALAEEVEDPDFAALGQDTIGFAGDPEEVFAIAQVEAEPEEHPVERPRLERKALRRPSHRSNLGVTSLRVTSCDCGLDVRAPLAIATFDWPLVLGFPASLELLISDCWFSSKLAFNIFDFALSEVPCKLSMSFKSLGARSELKMSSMGVTRSRVFDLLMSK